MNKIKPLLLSGENCVKMVLEQFNKEKQSRSVRVKCRTDGELPGGRKALNAYGACSASRCYT